ncbi:MAG: lysine 2,3-aminomutase [Desulfobulbaceae bacterium]|nr:lysine 2,3-aminomutase [Desulfobulbaceae bacterium]
MDYQAYSVANFRKIPQLCVLSEEQKKDIEVVAHILPFKVNNFVLDHLINWDNVPGDPIFTLTFPQRAMLVPRHYDEIAALLAQGAGKPVLKQAIDRIRLALNPHPAGQMDHNIPYVNGEPLPGVQHKYRQTVLYFPSQGQTCHAHCTFCFRWPQFTGMTEMRFAGREIELLIDYVREHPEITDILFTGGDPLVMSVKSLAANLEPLLAAKLPNLRRIRIGTKALTYWPFRFLTDNDSTELLDLFKRVMASGLHLAIMAHFNHPHELASPVVRDALQRVRQTGAEIRTQSPLMRHINDDAEVWRELWDLQVDQGCIPYYMFIARDTGAHQYFNIPLVRAWEIFRLAYQQVSGLCRTVRGPVMSTNPGKIQIMGVSEIRGEKVLALRFLQGRDPDWVQRPFFAGYDQTATWLNELKPAFGEKRFFFEDTLESTYRENINTSTIFNYE